jgi:hypothetical protein
MGKLKDDSNFQIYGWMSTKLKLKGNELLIYAIIYSFSRNNNGNGVFNASTSYISEWTGLVRKNIINCLSKLVEKKLIIKLEDNSTKRKPNVYIINRLVLNQLVTKSNMTSYEKYLALVTKSNMTSYETKHNNNIINTIDNNIINDDNKEPLNTEKQIEKYYDDDFKEVADSFSNNIHPINGKLEADMLIDLIDEYGKQWVIEGITEMVKYHGTNVAYLNRILLNWKKYGKNNKPKKEQQQMNSAEYGF